MRTFQVRPIKASMTVVCPDCRSRTEIGVARQYPSSKRESARWPSHLGFPNSLGPIQNQPNRILANTCHRAW